MPAGLAGVCSSTCGSQRVLRWPGRAPAHMPVFLPAGVGGIETEAVMLGLPVALTLPEVVGCELTGSSNPFVTSIDVVLGVTKVRGRCGAVGPSGAVSKSVQGPLRAASALSRPQPCHRSAR